MMDTERKWELIALWLEGQLNEQDKVEFEQIRALSPEDINFATMVWRNTRATHSFQKPDVEGAIQAMKSRIHKVPASVPKSKPAFGWTRYAVAASLVLAMAVAVFYLLQSNGFQRIEPADTLDPFILPDGTAVTVHQGTVEFRKGLTGETRQITLKGKASFDVAKDAARPFVVNTAYTQTKVLGTSFTLSENPPATDIEVRKGKVEFSAGESKVRLEAGDAARFDGREVFFIAGKPLTFDNQTLEQIASVLQEKFGWTIEFTHRDMKSMALTLTIDPVLGRRKIATLLSEVTGFVFEIKDDRLICKP